MMKLALFHTLFNLIGVLVVSPFVTQMVIVLKKLFVPKGVPFGKPKYLDEMVIEMSEPALVAMQKETERLYDKAIKALTHALLLHRHDVWSEKPIKEIVEESRQSIPIDIESYYRRNIKGLYGEIIKYATMAQAHMENEDQQRAYEYKLASRDIAEALKNVKELQKNITRHVQSPNIYIRREYNGIREKIATLLRGIEKVRQKPNDILAVTQIEVIKQDAEEMDTLSNKRIDELIRSSQIDTEMATSLMNDSEIAYDVIHNLLEMATILWIESPHIRSIQLDDEEG